MEFSDGHKFFVALSGVHVFQGTDFHLHIPDNNSVLSVSRVSSLTIQSLDVIFSPSAAAKKETSACLEDIMGQRNEYREIFPGT